MKIYQPKFDQLWKKIVGIELYAKENKEYIFIDFYTMISFRMFVSKKRGRNDCGWKKNIIKFILSMIWKLSNNKRKKDRKL